MLLEFEGSSLVAAFSPVEPAAPCTMSADSKLMPQ
jgi:hypothetical protein